MVKMVKMVKQDGQDSQDSQESEELLDKLKPCIATGPQLMFLRKLHSYNNLPRLLLEVR